MQDVIAPYLTSTYKMIECAFPDGIDSQSYFPLLALLYYEMSDFSEVRNLARVVAECTGKNYAVVLNDLYRVKSTDVRPGDRSCERASACLRLLRVVERALSGGDRDRRLLCNGYIFAGATTNPFPGGCR